MKRNMCNKKWKNLLAITLISMCFLGQPVIPVYAEEIPATETEGGIVEELLDEYGQPIIDTVTDAAKEAIEEAAKEAKEEVKETFWQAVQNFFLEIKEMLQEWINSFFE